MKSLPSHQAKTQKKFGIGFCYKTDEGLIALDPKKVIMVHHKPSDVDNLLSFIEHCKNLSQCKTTREMADDCLKDYNKKGSCAPTLTCLFLIFHSVKRI